MEPLRALVADIARSPQVIGAVLCDDEGEAVFVSSGEAELPSGATARASEHMPRTMALDVPERDFLLRLGSAETCGLLRVLQRVAQTRGAGAVEFVHLRYAHVDVILRALPEDFYVAVFVKSSNAAPGVRARILRALPGLEAELR